MVPLAASVDDVICGALGHLRGPRTETGARRQTSRYRMASSRAGSLADRARGPAPPRCRLRP